MDRTASEQRDKEEEEKRRAGAAPWLSRAGARGPAGAGLDWSSPAAFLRSGWSVLAYSPQAGLLRVALGAAAAVHAVLLGVFLVENAPDGGPAFFNGALAPPESRQDSNGAFGAGIAKPSVESLVVGLGNVLFPGSRLNDAPAAAAEDSGAAAADQLADSAEPTSGLPDEDSRKNGAERSELGPGEGQGAPGDKPSLAGTLASLGSSPGGGMQSSAAQAGPPPGKGAAGKSSSERRKTLPTGARGIARGPGGGRGALGQLRFADTMSNKGKYDSSGERAYKAAGNAFSGQTGTAGAGDSIGGAGDSVGGGSGVGSSPSSRPSGPVADAPQQNYSCPAGYILRGTECQPLDDGRNKTPWQGMVNTARMFLVAAAALALVGLLLLTKPGPAQILGGVLLGLAAGLVVAAMSIGMQIEDRYGQAPQRRAIDDAGGSAMKGQKP